MSPSPICTSAWELVPRRMPRSDRYATASRISAQKILVVGYKLCHVFHVDTKKWTKMPLMPTRRFGCPAVYHKNTLYVMGGYSNGWLSTVESFSMDVRKWQSEPPMLSKRNYCAAACVEDSIVVVGGHDGTSCLESAECFDVRHRVWNVLPDMACKRMGCVAVAVDARVYVFGGWGSPHSQDTAEAFDTRTNTWEALPRMPRKRCDGAAVTIGPFILLIGGEGGGFKKIDTVDCFDTTTRQWVSNNDNKSLAPLNIPRSHSAAASIEGEIYIFGGTGKRQNEVNKVEKVVVDPFYFVPRLQPLMDKDKKMPLGLWSNIIARCPANVVHHVLRSDRFGFDSVLLHTK